MDKLEMVIKGLECCIDGTARADKCWENGDYPECPYNHDVDGCIDRLDRDALALLKAQEPVEPIYGEDNYIRCGKCKHHIVGIMAQDTGNVMQIQKYCSECGQAVKWE